MNTHGSDEIDTPIDNARQRLGRNVRWLALAEICTKGFGLIAVAFLTRRLGAVGLGQYALGFVWLEILSELHGLSLEDVIARDVAQKPQTAARTLLGSLALIALITPVIILGAFAVSLVYRDVLGIGLIGIFIASVLRTPARMLLSFYTAEENLRPFSIWQSAEKFGIAGSTVLVLLLGGGIRWIFWMLPIVYLLLLVPVLTGAIRRYGVDFAGRRDIGYLFRRGLEFTGLKFVSLLYNRIDIVLVERLLDLHMAGLYSAARRLLDVLRSVPLLIAKGLYPVLSRKFTEGLPALGQVIGRFEKMMVLYSLPLVIGGIVLSYRIMGFIYGSGFDESGRIFIPFVWILILSSIRRPPMTYLIAAHRQNRATLILASGVALNILFLFVLIPRLGILGAVYAVLLPELLMVAVLFRELAVDRVPIPTRSIIGGPLAAAAVMTVAVVLARGLPLFVVIGIGAAVYVAGLLLLGGLDAEERAWTWRTLGLRT